MNTPIITGNKVVDVALAEYDRRCRDDYQSTPEHKAWLKKHRTEVFKVLAKHPARAEKIIVEFFAKIDREKLKP